MGKLNGRVAFISGVARGQGRAHAIKLASEGAAIIGFDICDQMETVPYDMATEADLAETVALVEKMDARIHAEVADVRDPEAVARVFQAGLAEFEFVDIVVANAGIMPVIGDASTTMRAWNDAIAVMLTGVMTTIETVRPHMQQRDQGGAIVITSSTAGLKGMPADNFGSLGYVAAKHGVVGLMKSYAQMLGPQFIRVNTVHPTGVNTPMISNEAFLQFMIANPAVAESMQNIMPVSTIEPEDVANAVAWLVSDDAQYITGVSLPVDAGFAQR